jgi:nucleoside triphosphate pyrophosphatase
MSPPAGRLVLASASPRRAEILAALGIPFDVVPSRVEETLLPGEDAVGAASRLAREKARDVYRPGSVPVLAADTLVFLGATILGKPADAADARRMLSLLSGATHSVVTSVALLSEDALFEESAVSRVRFASLSDEEIAWYAASREPLDKAGAYAVQGAGARFVESIEGSPSNVIGLPARSVYGLLRRAGLLPLALPGGAAGREGR